jgi:hypothetical protein
MVGRAVQRSGQGVATSPSVAVTLGVRVRVVEEQ